MKIETKYPNVFIDLDQEELSYKIIQIINNKNKIRRRVSGRPRKKSLPGKPKHDQFGNHLCDRFHDNDDAIQNAQNYVNNHLILK